MHVGGRTSSPLLGSWFIGGFEGSSHRCSDGRRLDLVAATRHDQFAGTDFARLQRIGITAARESLRWHLVERVPGHFDFTPELARMRAAAAAGITIAWDLCHFGWPDHTDPFRPDFPARFAEWAGAVGRLMARELDGPHWIAPQNEISFLSWAGGEVGVMNPHVRGRGSELKRQLVRGAVLAIDAIRSELPNARFIHPEPLINIAADPARPHERLRAARATEAQFEAWDMMAGRSAPELGGSPAHLDVIGANYYPDNQWAPGGESLAADSEQRRPLSSMLRALHRRYGRPIIISETGAEDRARAPWLRGVSADVDEAMSGGVPVEGICLYPIVNHPGWEDDRHCRNGVWDYPGPRGGRRPHRPLVRQIAGPTRSFVPPIGPEHGQGSDVGRSAP